MNDRQEKCVITEENTNTQKEDKETQGNEVEECANMSRDEEENLLWDGESDELKVGLTFNSRAQARSFVKKYSDRVKCKMIVSAGGAGAGCTSRQVEYLNQI